MWSLNPNYLIIFSKQRGKVKNWVHKSDKKKTRSRGLMHLSYQFIENALMNLWNEYSYSKQNICSQQGPKKIGVSVLYPLSEIRVTIKGSLLILELHFPRKGQELQISQKVFVHFSLHFFNFCSFFSLV